MINIKTALTNLNKIDAGLQPHFRDIEMHLQRYNTAYNALTADGSLLDVGNDYLYFGFHRTEDGWVYREWLEGADAAWLMGDFNGWNAYATPLTHIGGGVWELKLTGRDALKHGQYVKLVVGRQGTSFQRLPAYITRATLDKSNMKLCGQIWAPDEEFVWTDSNWYGKKKHNTPLIYEAHVGMAQEYGGIGTYREFADNNLPWIKELGYNTIQLMAIQEHPYYASFGYQVTNFFAPSHHYGTPEDLKYLVNKAHGMGLAVILDVVHSHSCPNVEEGLNLQDGTDSQYFHAGTRGWHTAWGTKCFDYGKHRVLRFLLSNLKYWQDNFHFDGFRFDGVTSMLYEDHGLGVSFTSYGCYYSLNTNVDAKVYLTLANKLIHEVNPKAITIAEDMSGMPGMCLPIKDAGVGFDYRLSMGVPDLWIKLIKEQPIEHWDVIRIWYELTGGRPKEKAIAYSESHDQAMVGDKTIIFRLADAEMYTGMEKCYHTPSMDTAIDMHKLIRFVTFSLANGGYLNFMGNEFGHPEWIDFPREGNGWSYHHARRQWSLVHNGYLKYEWLANFDRDMVKLIKADKSFFNHKADNLWMDNDKKLLIFARGDYIFAFNMHPTWSHQDVFVNCRVTGEGNYRVVFSSDDEAYGGQSRISGDYIYTARQGSNGLGFSLYLPCRTVAVLKKCN